MDKLVASCRTEDLSSLEGVYKVAAKWAQKTAEQGNYGVFSMLFDERGELLFAAPNTTITGFKHRNGNGDIDIIQQYTDGHAEKEVVRQLFEAMRKQPGKYDPSKMTMVVNLMCCPMCTETVLRAGIGKVFTASPDPGVAIGSAMYPEGSYDRLRADAIFVRPKTRLSDGMSEVYYLDEEGEEQARKTYVARREISHTQPILFDGQFVSAEIIGLNHAAFHDSAHIVRAHKERIKSESVPWNGKNALEEIIEGRAPAGLRDFFQASVAHKLTYEDMDLLTIEALRDKPDYIISEIAREAVDSARKGDRPNSIAVFDPSGKLLFLKGDRGAEKTTLFHTPAERGLKVAEHMHRSCPPKYKEWFPHPGELIYVSLQGPSIGTAHRFGGVMTKNALFLRHNHGDQGWAAPVYSRTTPFWWESGQIVLPDGRKTEGRGLGNALQCCGTDITNEIINKHAREFHISGLDDRRHTLLEPAAQIIRGR